MVDQQRDEKGRFVTGNAGNRAAPGRPAGLASYIRKQTKDGQEMIDVCLSIMRDLGAAEKARLEAVNILLERGFGRVPVTVDITHRIREMAESYGLDADEAIREAMAIVASAG